MQAVNTCGRLRGGGLLCLAGCLSIDEIQTPNGDIELARDEAAAGAGGGAARQADPAVEVCGSQGFRLVRAAGRELSGSWSRASLVPSCSGTRYRLSALAPLLESSFAVELTGDGTRVIQASYSTLNLGADGEQWGEFEAVVDVAALRFGQLLQSGEVPFELSGTILGPYGPVSFEAAGCAERRLNPC